MDSAWMVRPALAGAASLAELDGSLGSRKTINRQRIAESVLMNPDCSQCQNEFPISLRLRSWSRPNAQVSVARRFATGNPPTRFFNVRRRAAFSGARWPRRRRARMFEVKEAAQHAQPIFGPSG